MSDLPIDPETGFMNPDPPDLTEEGPEAVAQRLWIVLRLFKGEYEFFPKDGVDWYRFVLGKKFIPSRLNTAFVPVILATKGVLQILEDIKYTLNRKTRKLGVKVSVLTTTGDIVEAEV